MGKINTDNYPNRPFSSYQDDDMFILQDNGGETYTTNVGDIKNLADSRIKLEGVQVNGTDLPISGKKVNVDISGKTDLRVIAFPFHDPEPGEPSMGFFKGAYVTYNGKLYEFTQEHTGAWNPSHVREIDVDGMYVRAGNGGYNTGRYSTTEGSSTRAEGEAAHAEGIGTIANSDYQHAEGKYNVADTDDEYALIVGNGTADNARSNAMTLDWDGNLEVSGEVEDGNGEKISDKTDKVTNATSGHLAGLDANGNLTDSGVSPTEDVTVEGNPVTFESPFEQDAKSVVVSVKPIQAGSGTPSPENIRPISGIDEVEIGVSGKNLFNIADGSLESGKITISNGLIKINGTFNNRTVVLDDLVDIAQLNKFVGKRLSFSKTNVKGDFNKNEVFFSANGVWHYWGSNNSIILDRELINFVIYIEDTVDVEFYLQVELGSTPTPYEPYKGSTTTIPLPQTVYDGDVDVTEGSADDKSGMVDENDFGEVFGTSVGGLHWCDAPVGGLVEGNLLSNMLLDVNSTEGWYSSEPCCTLTSSGTVRVYGTFTSIEEFKAQYAGLQVCYELATPTAISFDPTDVELLEGTNVVSTNGEKVAVTYGRSLWQDIDDLKTDTEGKLDKSNVADVEGDTASKAYAVNDFMLRADGLYKVTAPIAQNASITSSNTTKTTIGAVLTALLNA